MNKPKSNAKTVIELCNNAAAITFAGGYCQNYDGTRTLFADHGIGLPKLLEEKRNAEGRVTNCLYQYSGGSRLRSRWSPKNGNSMEAVK